MTDTILPQTRVPAEVFARKDIGWIVVAAHLAHSLLEVGMTHRFKTEIAQNDSGLEWVIGQWWKTIAKLRVKP